MDDWFRHAGCSHAGCIDIAGQVDVGHWFQRPVVVAQVEKAVGVLEEAWPCEAHVVVVVPVPQPVGVGVCLQVADVMCDDAAAGKGNEACNRAGHVVIRGDGNEAARLRYAEDAQVAAVFAQGDVDRLAVHIDSQAAWIEAGKLHHGCRAAERAVEVVAAQARLAQDQYEAAVAGQAE
jgi:hypothetical protein